jgi:hypothetical protein
MQYVQRVRDLEREESAKLNAALRIQRLSRSRQGRHRMTEVVQAALQRKREHRAARRLQAAARNRLLALDAKMCRVCGV